MVILLIGVWIWYFFNLKYKGIVKLGILISVVIVMLILVWVIVSKVFLKLVVVLFDLVSIVINEEVLSIV